MPGSNNVDPWLGNIGNVASTRIEDISAEQYILDSILNPVIHIATDCPGGPGVEAHMENLQFSNRLNPQEMEDLLAYLRALEEE